MDCGKKQSPTEKAAEEIRRRFFNPAHPLSGFFAGVGVSGNSMAIYCRSEPDEEQRKICLELAVGLEIEFVVNVDFFTLD